MKKTLDEHRHKLITKIRFATSPTEVKQQCNGAIHDLEGQRMNTHHILLFLEKTVDELANLSPVNQNTQQWSNIINAKVLCSRLIKEYSFSHE